MPMNIKIIQHNVRTFNFFCLLYNLTSIYRQNHSNFLHYFKFIVYAYFNEQ